ncbi:MAG TPA: alpha/beta fold hydrolase [Longimicrobiaceae bacterium]|nr:alpha/beta fold hydrolase [Longimicrobiaceae bacterium]
MNPLPVLRAWAVPALALGSVTLTAAPLAAQAAAPAAPAQKAAFDLSVDNIMRGPGLYGFSPEAVRWSADSRSVYFRWRTPESTDTATHIYRVAATGGTPQLVPDSMAERVAPGFRTAWSIDGRTRAEIRDGDVYLVGADGRVTRITDTPTRERDPQLSTDGRTVYFLSGHDLFALEVAGGPFRQLTDIRQEKEPKEKEAKGQKKYLEDQQKELFDVIRDRIAEREHEEAVDSARTRVHATYLGADSRLMSAEVSPSGRYALLGVGVSADDRGVIVPNFVTESGYTEDIHGRSKVGDVQAGQRAAILDLQTGELQWIEPGPKDRDLSLMPAGWAPRSDRALLMAIPADYHDRWIYSITPGDSVTVLDHLHDDAWVGGPGLFTAGWIPGSERVYFVSERSGYAHLYTVPGTGGEAKALTEGNWEVTDVALSRDGRTFYLTTSETDPGERNLYTLPVDGGKLRRVTNMPGWSESVVSPDGRHVAVLNSDENRPPELYLMGMNGAKPQRVTLSTTAEFRRGPWLNPDLFTITARDGAPIRARIFRPADLGAEPNGAAVLFVHGAGYLQDVKHGWSDSYPREFMFNHLLASRGFTVLEIDYRGSSGYGRDWRTGIYRHMGGKDLTDHVDAVKWLVQNEGIDPDRVGIYGGSYGGFMTLMALFTEPDIFTSGAALRSVTDWAHYNHWYTSRILNQPQDDPEAYRRSSPIYFAEGLEGDLLIAHGMVDTNVHFQDVVRLAQRLIELGKTNWEMAVYPVESHGFVRPESWTDEYRRILELFEGKLR